MALTATQKLQIKKHIGVGSWEVVLDPMFLVIEADADRESELTALLTELNTALSDWKTAMTDADEITSGEGATLDHNRKIAIKKRHYAMLCEELSRLMAYPVQNVMLKGVGGGTTGWDNGTC